MANFDFSVGSSAQRVCVADSDDRFEIWSVDAGEILPFRVDGGPVFVGGAAGLCAVVDVPGDYRIEFADDYCPKDNAPAFSVGPADAADVCCVAPIKDADGKLVGLTIDGSDELFAGGFVGTDTYLKPKEPTTDTITGVVTTCFDLVDGDDTVITADVWCHKSSDTVNLSGCGCCGENSDVVGDMSELGERLGTSGTTYIIAGDSTRDNSYNEAIPYYSELLDQVGVSVVDTAQSGLDSTEWLNNIFAGSGLNDAIAATSGTGATTIMEFSFGLNDYTTASSDIAQVEVALRAALDAYIAAKPDTLIYLVSPVPTTTSIRNDELDTLYKSLAASYGFPLYMTKGTMLTMVGNPDFYQDNVHPNAAGSKRLINNILSAVVGCSVGYKITLPVTSTPVPTESNLFSPKSCGNADNLAGAPESGFWNNSNGLPIASASWLRLPAISVQEDTAYSVDNPNGSVFTVNWIDSAGAVIQLDTYTNPATVIAPSGADEALLNVSSDSATNNGTNVTLTCVDTLTLSGYWNLTTGLPVVNSSWLRLAPIAVQDGFDLSILHGGDQSSVVFLDSSGNHLSFDIYTGTSVTVPSGATTALINVSSDAENHAIPSDGITVKYAPDGELSQEQINHGTCACFMVGVPASTSSDGGATQTTQVEQKDECGDEFSAGSKNLITTDLIRLPEAYVDVGGTKVVFRAALPDNPITAHVFEREDGVIVVNNPHSCLDLYVDIDFGGRGLVFYDAQNLGENHASIALVENRIYANGVEVGYESVANAVAGDGGADGYEHRPVRTQTVQAGQSLSIDRSSMYTNGNNAGEIPEYVLYRLPRIVVKSRYI